MVETIDCIDGTGTSRMVTKTTVVTTTTTTAAAAAATAMKVSKNV